MKANGWVVAMMMMGAAAWTGCESMTGHKSQGTALSALRPGQMYEINGTITKVKGDEITLARQGLPVAKLKVQNVTQVTLNGTAVTAKALPEGGQTRARFQLEEDKPIALELTVTTPGRESTGTMGTGMESKPPESQPDSMSNPPPPDSNPH